MRNYLRAKIRTPDLFSAFNLLREQEEDEGGGDEGGGDEGGEALLGEEGEDEGGEEGGGDEATEEGEDEGGDEDSKKDEKDPALKISAEEKARLEDSLDDELEGLMIDYETDARKAAQIQSEKMKTESLRHVYRGLLYEIAAEDIDLKHFASNLTRLVKNYDTLIDMKSVILNKAYSYIKNNYGDDTVKALKDTLEQDFDIEIDKPDIEKDEPEVPIAVGAGGGAAGGA